jgi:hypothetical protein
LIITRRKDVASPIPDIAAASALNSTAPVSIWIGDVVGYRRGSSSAILVTSENGGVYGKITYIDRSTNKEHTYTVSTCCGCFCNLGLIGQLLASFQISSVGPTLCSASTHVHACKFAPLVSSTAPAAAAVYQLRVRHLSN